MRYELFGFPVAAIIAVAVYALVIFGMTTIGEDFVGIVGIPNVAELPQAAARSANVIAAADQAIGMLFTTTVGLIVGVGFIFRDSDFRVGMKTHTILVPLAAFMVSAVAAVFFAFLARMEVLLVAHASLSSYDPLDNAIGLQALAVALCAGGALAMFVTYLVEKRAVPEAPVRKRLAAKSRTGG